MIIAIVGRHYVRSCISNVWLIPAGIALVLFAFGKFSFLGWRGEREPVHPHLLPGVTTASQRATIKYFFAPPQPRLPHPLPPTALPPVLLRAAPRPARRPATCAGAGQARPYEVR